MSIFLGIVGALLLASAAKSMDTHIEPSNVVGVSAGGFLLLVAVLAWFFGADE